MGVLAEETVGSRASGAQQLGKEYPVLEKKLDTLSEKTYVTTLNRYQRKAVRGGNGDRLMDTQNNNSLGIYRPGRRTGRRPA